MRLVLSVLSLWPLVTALNFKVLHFNDIHGRIDPQSKLDADCTAADIQNGVCHGGAGRIVSAIKAARLSYADNMIVLDAGDEAMGTIWESFYQANISVAFQKAAGVQAFTLGNHECDRGVAWLSNMLQLATTGEGAFPVLSANLVDASGLLSPYLRNSTVLNVNGTQIGVIGVTTPTTKFTSSCGPSVTFTDPVAAVREEAARLRASNVSTILVLSHLGYQQDIALAQQAPEVDLIVGGHSHSYLYTPTDTNPLPLLNTATEEHDTPVGDYPTFVPVSGTSAGFVPVVQARWAARYLGMLDVTVDDHGALVSATGSPLLLGDSAASSVVGQDPTFEAYLAPLRSNLDVYRNTVVGAVAGDFWLNDTRTQETAIGDLFCDALWWYVNERMSVANLTEYGTIDACIVNGGSIRSGLAQGNVTLAQLVALSPFGNNLVVKRVNGTLLKQILTFGLSALPASSGGFPQVGGLVLGYDLTINGTDNRLVQAYVYDKNNRVDRILDQLNYTFVTNSYIASGGDNYTMVPGAETLLDFGPTVTEVLSAYFQANAADPFAPIVDGRIINCGRKHELGTFAQVLCMNNLSPGDPREGPWAVGGSVGEAVWTISAILSLILVAAFVTSPYGRASYGLGGPPDEARQRLKTGPDSTDLVIGVLEEEEAKGGFERRLESLEHEVSAGRSQKATASQVDLAGLQQPDPEDEIQPSTSSPAQGPSGHAANGNGASATIAGSPVSGVSLGHGLPESSTAAAAGLGEGHPLQGGAGVGTAAPTTPQDKFSEISFR